MSEIDDLLARFRSAFEKIEKRIELAEAAPLRADYDELLNARKADLERFEQLKKKLVALKGEAEE